MTPAQQVAFVRSYLTAFDVTFDSVYWENDGVVVVNWQPYGREADVIVGKAYELLSRARGERPFACGQCWADPYEALDHARNRIAKYEALVAALRDLGFDKGWESVDRWYGSNWRPVHDALSALEDR